MGISRIHFELQPEQQDKIVCLISFPLQEYFASKPHGSIKFDVSGYGPLYEYTAEQHLTDKAKWFNYVEPQKLKEVVAR